MYRLFSWVHSYFSGKVRAFGISDTRVHPKGVYAGLVHLYRDPVAGFALRTHFPLVCEWVERTNGEGALNARIFGQKLYSLGPDGALVGRCASSDGADWLPDDAISETLDDFLDGCRIRKKGARLYSA